MMLLVMMLTTMKTMTAWAQTEIEDLTYNATDGCYDIGIPLGYGLVGMWVGFAIDENVRGVILVRRWRSGKWRTKGFVK